MPGAWTVASTKSKKMLWSLVPTETTDWKLEVDAPPTDCNFDETDGNPTKKQKRTETYYVHKNVLADTDGPNGSMYFQNLFSQEIEGQGRFKESHLGVSRLHFPESVAAAMPVFLDFMYGNATVVSTAGTSSTTIATRTATMSSSTAGNPDTDIDNEGSDASDTNDLGDNNSNKKRKSSSSGRHRIVARKEPAEHPYGSDEEDDENGHEDEDMEEETLVDEHINKVSNVVRSSPELYYLGDYFIVPSLQNYVLEELSTSAIIKTIDDACTIYTKADSLGLVCEEILSMILKIIVCNLSTIEPTDEIVQTAPLGFWLNVAKALAADYDDDEDLDWEVDSRHWSELVVQIVESNRDSMTHLAFQVLTSVESLPIVSHCTVSQLIKFDDEFRPKDLSLATHNHHDELSLHSRCAKAIADCHSILSFEQASSLLTNHTHDFVAKVLFYQSRNVGSYKTELDCAVKVVSGFHPVRRGTRVLTQTQSVSPTNEIVRYHDTLTESKACQRFLNNEQQSSVYYYNGP